MKISAFTLVFVSLFYTAGSHQTTWSPALGTYTCDAAGLTCTIIGCGFCTSIAAGFEKWDKPSGTSTTYTAKNRNGSNVMQVAGGLTTGSTITCDAGCVCDTSATNGDGCLVFDDSNSGGVGSPGMTAGLSTMTASAVITVLFL
jgi:hypothetical protein